MPHPTVADIVAVLERRYPPATAEDWDAVGLACGDPDDVVRRILFAVDPVGAVADEAAGMGADLLVTHHPLLLRPVHSIAATTAKGRVLQTLGRHRIALYSAHTNADAAHPGVSDALAARLGLVDLRPLAAAPAPPRDKVIVFVPAEHADLLLAAMADAGAGVIGAYDSCAFLLDGEGRFRPGPGAAPHIGEVGRLERVPERRVEMVLPRERRAAVIAAVRAVHPYQEPAFDLIELASSPGPTGLGRVGGLPEPMTLADFGQRVAAGVPATAAGIRIAGDPARVVREVAVCGGAGGSLLDAAQRSGADAFVTSDLGHHRAQDHLEGGGCALVDVPHWAGEWPWLAEAADLLRTDLAESGTTVELRVSARPTDPWSAHI